MSHAERSKRSSSAVTETAVRKKNPYKNIARLAAEADRKTTSDAPMESSNPRPEPSSALQPKVNQKYSYEELTGGLGRAVAFRAQRYLIRDLLPKQKAALFIEQQEFPLHDVSMNGLSFFIREVDSPWEIDDELDIAISVLGEPVYEGQARVVRIDRSTDQLRVGLQLTSGFLDLLELRQKDEEKALENVLRVGPSSVLNAVPKEYRAIIERITHFLNFYRRSLGYHEARYREVDNIASGGVSALAARAADAMRPEWQSLRVLAAQAAMPYLTRRHTLQAMKDYTEDMVTSIIASAPIVHRSYTKPLGYPGDYQVMNQVYRNTLEGASTLDQVFHKFVCEEPLAAGVRTRKDLIKEIQTEEHVRFASRHEADVFRVTNLACGPAKEVSELAADTTELAGPIHWTLIDQEERALNLAYHAAYQSITQSRAPATLRCMFMSFGQLLRDPIAALGEVPQHMIYASGLFDYLSDLSAQSLVRTLYDNLAPGGLLAIGNACAPTLNFWIPEFVLDWSLIYRTEEQMFGLLKKINNPAESRVVMEPSHGYHFLLVRKD